MSGATTLDVDFVRDQFPGLGDWAFCENAGGTMVPNQVIDRVRAYMTETQVQPGGAFPASARAAEKMAESQRLMAAMINADADEIVIGPSTTMNVYVLSHAIRPWLQPGDEVVVTNLDHEANNGAWRRLEEIGVVIREWQIDPETAELEPDALARLLNARTRLVCFTHCSNITGGIHDVAALVRMIHDAGALACVDAVAYAPHRALDVRALDVDFYLCSLYKLYGPHVAMLYGKREHLLRAQPQNHYFIGDENLPLKLNPGGPNHEFWASLSGIAAYFDDLHAHHFPGSNTDLHGRFAACFGLVAAHEGRLAARFMDFLAARADIRVIGRATGDPARRVPTFSFVVEGRDAGEIAAEAGKRGVGIGAGDFYAARVIDALGLRERGGVVRVSMVHYNTEAEVDRVIRVLDEIL